MTSLLLTATLELLKSKSRDEMKLLAEQCDVTIEWLLLLTAGRIKEPGVNKVERLYNALSNKTVQL